MAIPLLNCGHGTLTADEVGDLPEGTVAIVTNVTKGAPCGLVVFLTAHVVHVALIEGGNTKPEYVSPYSVLLTHGLIHGTAMESAIAAIAAVQEATRRANRCCHGPDN